MDTNISAEVNDNDPVIVAPWVDPSGRLQYVEAHDGTSWVDEVIEAREWPEMREALLAIHKGQQVATVKCDAWILADDERQLDFGPVDHGIGAYIDTVPRTTDLTIDSLLMRVQHWARALSDFAAEARCDFVIRPARIREVTGYAVTVYVFGYGDTKQEARMNWAAALQKVAALLSDADGTIGSAGE